MEMHIPDAAFPCGPQKQCTLALFETKMNEGLQ